MASSVATREALEMIAVMERGLLEGAQHAKAVSLAPSAPTVKRRADTSDNHKRLLERLREFRAAVDKSLPNADDGGGSAAASSAASTKNKQHQQQQVAYDEAALERLCGLGVPKSRLAKVTMNGDGSALRKTAEELKGMRGHRGFGNLKAVSDSLPRFFEQGNETLLKCVELLESPASHLEGSQWGAATVDVFKLLRTVLDNPHLQSVIDEGMESLRRMLFTVEEIEQQQQQAVVDGEMKLSEVLYFKKIALQETMVEKFNGIFQQIEDHEQECFVAPVKEVHVIHGKTNAIVSEMIKVQENTKDAVQKDVKTLKDTFYSLRADDEASRKQHAEFVKVNERRLSENASQQDECFAAMMELEKRIVQLAEQRAGLVQNHVDAVLRERKRLVDVASFGQFYSDRSALLVNTLASCEVADEVTDLVDEFVCSACNAMERHLRSVQADVERHRMSAHELRLEHFRGMYLTLGELQYKKERNLEEIDKKIAYTHMQQDLMMETLNPKAKEFAQAKKELVKVRDEMESQIAVIHEKAALQIEAFKPTETLLIEAGKDFVHPVQELQQRNQARQQKLLQYHKLMSSEDGGALDDDVASPLDEESGGSIGSVSPNRRSRGGFDVEAELRAIEAERERMQPRKLRSSGGGDQGGGTSKRVGFGLANELEPLPDRVRQNLSAADSRNLSAEEYLRRSNENSPMRAAGGGSPTSRPVSKGGRGLDID